MVQPASLLYFLSLSGYRRNAIFKRLTRPSLFIYRITKHQTWKHALRVKPSPFLLRGPWPIFLLDGWRFDNLVHACRHSNLYRHTPDITRRTQIVVYISLQRWLAFHFWPYKNRIWFIYIKIGWKPLHSSRKKKHILLEEHENKRSRARVFKLLCFM